jgi:diguanylate cyclase (GGDEF)-like protein
MPETISVNNRENTAHKVGEFTLENLSPHQFRTGSDESASNSKAGLSMQEALIDVWDPRMPRDRVVTDNGDTITEARFGNFKESREVYLESLKLKHDILTGLEKRDLFFSNFKQFAVAAHFNIINATKRQDANNKTPNTFAVVFGDLDGLKELNTTFGHVGADSVLAEAAKRMKGSVRNDDKVHRMSGDEFSFLLRGIDNQDELTKTIENIRYRVCGPVEEGKTQGAIIGISLGGVIISESEIKTFIEEMDESQQLEFIMSKLDIADKIMYADKNKRHAVADTMSKIA